MVLKGDSMVSCESAVRRCSRLAAVWKEYVLLKFTLNLPLAAEIG